MSKSSTTNECQSNGNSSFDYHDIAPSDYAVDRSDSILSQDSLEHAAAAPLPMESWPRRASSTVYMEEASMEIITTNNNHDATTMLPDTSRDNHADESVMMISPSGRAGRRHSSIHDNDVIRISRNGATVVADAAAAAVPSPASSPPDAHAAAAAIRPPLAWNSPSSRLSSSPPPLPPPFLLNPPDQHAAAAVAKDTARPRANSSSSNNAMTGNTGLSPLWLPHHPHKLVRQRWPRQRDRSTSRGKVMWTIPALPLSALEWYHVLPVTENAAAKHDDNRQLHDDNSNDHDDDDDPVPTLERLFAGFCRPPVPTAAWQRIYRDEAFRGNGPDQVDLPEVTICQPHRNDEAPSGIAKLLGTSTVPERLPLLLQLPPAFVRTVLRVLVRLLAAGESDAQYRDHCTLELANDGPVVPLESNDGGSSSSNTATHERVATQHVLDVAARFQCQDDDMERPTVTHALNLYEAAARSCGGSGGGNGDDDDGSSKLDLLAPLARLVAVVAVPGMTPQQLQRCLQMMQNTEWNVYARLLLVRACRYAVQANNRSWMAKQPPRAFFSLGGATGLRRTISGLPAWPFRNDFGMAMWFRAEHYHHQLETTTGSSMVLLSATSDEGGGIEVSLVPLDERRSDACTLAVSVYDSGGAGAGSRRKPTQSVRVKGCVLLPKIWYHVAIRHTRSRLKGVFSLSTRQHLSVMLDGKVMLSENFNFPKVADADFRDDTILHTTGLRRLSSNSSLNLNIEVGCNFDGQCGTVYVFKESVADATFRALFETTGGSKDGMKRQSSISTTWDARRGDIARKSRMLEAGMANEDAGDIILSSRKPAGPARQISVAIDLGDLDDTDNNHMANELQRPSFGSRVLVVFEPTRAAGSVGVELHLGAHVALDDSAACETVRLQSAIQSVGGIQAIIPLFRSFLLDMSREAIGAKEATSKYGLELPVLSELLLFCAALVQNNDPNARELLRCGGIDVIENFLLSRNRGHVRDDEVARPEDSMRLAAATLRALITLRESCTHYVGLETKIFRLLFNSDVWLHAANDKRGVAFHLIWLPALSSITKSGPVKVRDCIGAGVFVELARKYCDVTGSVSSQGSIRFGIMSPPLDGPLTVQERIYAARIALGMAFEVLVSGTTASDLAPLLHMLSNSIAHGWKSGADDQLLFHTLAKDLCMILLFLLKIKPTVNGLQESLSSCCGGVEGGAAWILSALVDNKDDDIRSLGILGISAYLESTANTADAPLSIMAHTRVTEENKTNPQSHGLNGSGGGGASARRSLGPGSMQGLANRQVAFAGGGSIGTARVVLKLVWHLLKSHRHEMGDRTRAALLSWLTDGTGVIPAALSDRGTIQYQLVTQEEGSIAQPGYLLSTLWVDSILTSSASVMGKSLRDSLAIGMVLRLIRYLDDDAKDQWLDDLIYLAKSNRKSVTLLCSLPDWQVSVFQWLSETLEFLEKSSKSSFTDDTPGNSTESNARLSVIKNRLDSCIALYSVLLGHAAREGGDKALEAVEGAALLQRVCVNGQHVFMLILSGLCSDLFENGTLLELREISREDWARVDIDNDSVLLRQSARLVTDAILSNGTKGLSLTSAIRSWRTLRHLTEVAVAVVTKCGFGIVDLFDYINQRAAAVDHISSGLHGIRLPDTRVAHVSAAEYLLYLQMTSKVTGSKEGHEERAEQERDVTASRDMDRRLCVVLAAQILALLDAFIFPDSLDASLPASQLHGLGLVRNAEPRLSQGPFVVSAIRLSLLLLALLEPSNTKFLESASRLRSLLFWSMELIREKSEAESSANASQQVVAVIDRNILAVALHCHRALGRCSALLAEIETSSYDTYFDNRESQRKHVRRVLRAALELRDNVLAIYRGRNDLLASALSEDAFDDLRAALEAQSPGASRENVAREFLMSRWVEKYQDVETRFDLAIPEQVSMDTVPIGIHRDGDSRIQGFAYIEQLANESSMITVDFEKALNPSFEAYLESQRKWAETDAVRELELEGEALVKRLSDCMAEDDREKDGRLSVRRFGADLRWQNIEEHTTDLLLDDDHWKLGSHADRLGRRQLLVRDKTFTDHNGARYDQSRGMNPPLRDTKENELADVMRKYADAFVVYGPSENDSTDDESTARVSDTESGSDIESVAEFEQARQAMYDNTADSDHDDEWDKIEAQEIEHVTLDGDGDGWARTFVWAEGETVVAGCDSVTILMLQSYVEGKVLLTNNNLYFKPTGPEMSTITKEPKHLDPHANFRAARRWRLSRLAEVHGRRYLLRQQALELFFADGHELFLNFPEGVRERDRFYAKLRNSCKTPMLWTPKSLNAKIVFRRSRLSELWKKRKISNFGYLMALNRMAGRSFNDITQYPVFPWVLADFTSDTIDLKDSRVYRDLSKPIGAINPDRLAQLLERFKDLELFGFSEAEKFLYGSHYSSPGIVLHYLIRQEPFTTMAIELQSGRFDCPDRLFFDLAASWNGCMTSTSDVKELIPEFYCLPELFLNTNNFPLGQTQTGIELDDVRLPPWANGSAHEFVRVHRLALESEHVSQQLHHWIDLVFGFQQRGDEAVAVHNLFHHLSYEGSVDLDKIVDEVDRAAAENHIQNFGQTPAQLYSLTSHPPRYAAEDSWQPLLRHVGAASQLRTTTPARQFANKAGELAKGAVVAIHVFSETVVVVYADLSVGTYRWLPTARTNRLRMDKLRPLPRHEFYASRSAMKRGSAVPELALEHKGVMVRNDSIGFTIGGRAKEELRRRAIMPTGRLISSGETPLVTLEAAALLVTCGCWDFTVKVHGLEPLRTLEADHGGHLGAITCLKIAADGALMVTGGLDGTCRVWTVGHAELAAALADGYVQTALGAAASTNESILSCCHVLWGHDAPITAVDVNSDLDLIVSGSRSGKVCVHTLRRGEFVRALMPPALHVTTTAAATTFSSIVKLALASTGHVLIHGADHGLHVFTINGVHLCSVNAGERLAEIVICHDAFALTGGERGHVMIRHVHDLQVVHTVDLSAHGPIHCVSLTPDDLNPIVQCGFVGSDDGMVTIIDHDPTMISTTTPQPAETVHL